MPILRPIAVALLLVSAGAVGLFRGGVPAWAQALACAGAGLGLLLAALGARRGHPLLPQVWYLAPLAICLVALLQCVPLPAGLLAQLVPGNWELRTLLPAPRPAWAPVTLDLWATLASAAAPMAVACALAAAGILGRHGRFRLLLCSLPVLAALGQSALVLVRLAGAGRVQGSFVNRNHLAALLVLGTLCALGAALEPPLRDGDPGRDPRQRRLPWIFAAVVTATCALLTRSRGGLFGLGLGAALLLVIHRARVEPEQRRARRQGAERPRRKAALLLAAALLTALGTAVLLGGNVFDRLGEVGQNGLPFRLHLFREATLLLREHPLFGVGRGTFRFLSELHRQLPGTESFLFVENEPLQLAVEEGVPVALLVLGLLVCAFAISLRRVEQGLERGVLAGALALGVHNLFDFNLSLLGVSLPLAVAVGAAAAPLRGRSVKVVHADAQPGASGRFLQRLEQLRLPRAVAFAAFPAALALSAAILVSEPHQAELEAADLGRLARDPAVPVETLRREAERVVASHPVDWISSLTPAIGLDQRTPRRSAEALAWAGRAQLLAPRLPEPHVTAGSILLHAGRRSQARVEARLAHNIALAVAASSGVDELLEATAEDTRSRAGLAGVLNGAGRAGEARGVCEAELRRLAEAGGAPADDPALVDLRSELGNAALLLGDGAAAEAQAQQMPRSSCAGLALSGRARVALGRPQAEVDAPLRQGLSLCTTERTFAELLVGDRLSRGDAAGALLLLDEQGIGAPGVPWAAEAHLWRARALELQGRTWAALDQRWLAATRAPDRPELGIDYAQHLRRAGDLPGAVAALRKLSLRATGPARARLEEELGTWTRASAPAASPAAPADRPAAAR